MERSHFRAYADENIPLDFISHLRNDLNLKIKSVVELNLSNKEDKFHFLKAKETHSFLLTNDKDFLDHSKYPFKEVFGLIILESFNCPTICRQIDYISQHTKIFFNSKIILNNESAKVLFMDKDGKLRKEEQPINECLGCFLEGN